MIEIDGIARRNNISVRHREYKKEDNVCPVCGKEYIYSLKVFWESGIKKCKHD